jgi:hypothetical protein
MIRGYFGEDDSKWPEVLISLREKGLDQAIAAYGISLYFLQQCLIDQQV